MYKVNRVSENAQTVTHEGLGGHAAEEDQLLGLMPPDRRRDPRDFPRERFEPPHQYGPPHPEDDSGLPMAAHPLFRGLLHELPARTDPPTAEFLECWITTARSILELLYRPGARH